MLEISLITNLLVLGTTTGRLQAQAGDLFPTQEAALKGSMELECSGAFAVGNQWMPCQDLRSQEPAIRTQP